MKIIAEAGATKTAWSAIADDGRVFRVSGPGINVSTMSRDLVRAHVSDALLGLNPEGEPVKEVHFYGAGVLSDELITLFPDACVECESDMLAAARAVCGSNPGVVAILGTGSNSCLYDGVRIVSNIHPGGFILGDEGGGASLGRMFLSDYIKDLVPEEDAVPFAEAHQAGYATIVRHVYKDPAPSGYLGSFAPWLLKRASSSEYIRGLVISNFRLFFERSLCRYGTHDVGIVGGFASAAREYLEPLAEEYGIRITGIYADISDQLLRYHR